MSTRGALGFRLNGQDFISYNHSDSYPSYLGQHTVDFLRARLAEPGGEDHLRSQVSSLRLVEENSVPSPEDIERFLPHANLRVSSGQPTEWYVLLRETQGDPEKILDAGVMIEGAAFLEDSLFCEWAYIINLDTREVEVYEGFQRAPHANGRYAQLGASKPWTPSYPGQNQYFPVALVATFSFDSLPPNLVRELAWAGVEAH